MNRINIQRILSIHRPLRHPAATISNELVPSTSLSCLSIPNNPRVQRKLPKTLFTQLHDAKKFVYECNLSKKIQQQRKEDFSPFSRRRKQNTATDLGSSSVVALELGIYCISQRRRKPNLSLYGSRFSQGPMGSPAPEILYLTPPPRNTHTLAHTPN